MAANPFDQFDAAPDYDYEGARAAGVNKGANGHWPDTYKLPNHITFSTDSKYSKPGKEGGEWSKVGGKWHYKPSAFVLSQHSPEELKSYFARSEPDSVLDIPDQSGAPANPFDQFDATAQAPKRPHDPMTDAPLLPGEEGFDNTPSPAPSMFRGLQQYGQRVNDAFGRLNRAPDTGALGSLEALGTMVTGGISAPILGTAESIALGTPPEESFARYTYQPRTESGKAQLGVLGALASPVTESGADVALAPLFAGESRVLGNPAKMARDARRSIPSRGSVPDQPEALDSAVAGRAPVEAAAQKTQRSAGPASVPKDAVPTRAQLSEAAQAAYKKADEAGVVVSANSLFKLKARVASMAKKEGIDKDLHPDSTAALRRILETKGQKTLSELETLRKVAKDAQGSLKPADKRLAGMIVDELDGYIDNLGGADVVAGDATKVSALKEARGYYSRAKKSEVIETLVQRAEDSAKNFSGSGLENAVRTEFRQLAKNEKRMRLFTKEEQAAIRKVAQGGKMENAMRFIGKFAPTGVVSGVLTGGAGAMIGGPLGAALPLAGIGGREAATRLTMRNVRNADELVRRGPAGANALAREAAETKRNALADF